MEDVSMGGCVSGMQRKKMCQWCVEDDVSMGGCVNGMERKKK